MQEFPLPLSLVERGQGVWGRVDAHDVASTGLAMGKSKENNVLSDVQTTAQPHTPRPPLHQGEGESRAFGRRCVNTVAAGLGSAPGAAP